jgi:hypothetical protein
MVNLKNLKVENEYYIVDKEGAYGDDIIIRFKVVKELIGKRKKGYVSVQFLQYIYDYGEEPVTYCDQKENEIIVEEIYKEDEERIFLLTDVDKANDYLEEKIIEHDFEYELDNYTPPEEYPDWDGDESIIYIIDHCNDYDDREDNDFFE